MNTAWQRLPERSNPFWLGTITWIALHLGSGLVRPLLYPITGYFVVFRNATLSATRRYLRRALDREPGWIDLFRLYHTFACTLVDRLYVLAGQDDRLQLDLHGLEVLERHAASGKGCLLVGSHLGSFEIIRALGRTRRGLRVKALMDVHATPHIAALYRSLNPALHEDIIPVGRSGALVGLDQFTAAGGMLALLGDRCLPGDKRVACDFLGEPAWFPQTPATLAQVLRVPMVLFVCLHAGWGRYALHFEELAEDRLVPRAEREAEAARIMHRYAGRLAHYARQAPYNWFNFHDVWQRDE